MRRFITTVLNPWNDLCGLLALQKTFESEMALPIGRAGDLAVAIKHLPEIYKFPKNHKLKDSLDFKLIDDVADGWKHGSNSLTNISRRHDLVVQANFEISQDDTKFAFVRNSIVVDHATAGSFDFLEVSARAIKHWISEADIQVQWEGMICMAEPLFIESAVLYNDSSLEPYLEKTRLAIRKKINGAMIPYDSPSISFEIRPLPLKI